MSNLFTTNIKSIIVHETSKVGVESVIFRKDQVSKQKSPNIKDLYISCLYTFVILQLLVCLYHILNFIVVNNKPFLIKAKEPTSIYEIFDIELPPLFIREE